jgi:hypothetical protein
MARDGALSGTALRSEDAFAACFSDDAVTLAGFGSGSVA